MSIRPIPSNAPVRPVNQTVDTLDIREITGTCKGGGTGSYHPRMMLKAVLFSCLNNIYSCRKIENALQDRITFMWLSAMQVQVHNTINTFRSTHLKNTVNHMFTQVVLMPVETGCLSPDVIYTDGTRMESRANRYTFVRRKTVEKIKPNSRKIRRVLEQTEEGTARDSQPNDAPPPAPVNPEELKRRIAESTGKPCQRNQRKNLKY